jgi:hypothetical protein
MFLMRLKEEAWHLCYGHLNFDRLKILHQKNMVMGFSKIYTSPQVYEECIVSKQRRNQFLQLKLQRIKMCLSETTLENGRSEINP